ncbi:MAG: hypothetical protein QOF31_5097 [Mycobacterium sp.]|jgi:hypothetical protein|nr:hypothetical protein [Mycobacterium sp.]
MSVHGAVRRLVQSSFHRDDYSSEWAVITAVSKRLGMNVETLRESLTLRVIEWGVHRPVQFNADRPRYRTPAPPTTSRTTSLLCALNRSACPAVSLADGSLADATANGHLTAAALHTRRRRDHRILSS